MMRRRNGKTSLSLLDLAKVGGGRQLGTPKELSRNGERRTIKSLEDREANVLSLGKLSSIPAKLREDAGTNLNLLSGK